MNRNKLAALVATIALTLFAIGCGGDSANNSNAGNANRSNANATNK
jgi:hypothetical protein